MKSYHILVVRNITSAVYRETELISLRREIRQQLGKQAYEVEVVDRVIELVYRDRRYEGVLKQARRDAALEAYARNSSSLVHGDL